MRTEDHYREAEKTAHAPDGLVAALADETRRKRARRRLCALALAGYVPALGAASLAFGLHHRIALITHLVMGSLVGGLWACLAVTEPSRAQRRAARMLSRHDDLRTVGPMAELMGYADLVLGVTVRDALLRLLPRLHGGHAPMLDAEHRAALYRLLHRCRTDGEAALVLAALRAVVHVGDEQAIPHVRRLADRGACADKADAIATAAREALPELERRAAQRQAAAMLMRSAAPPSAAAHGLLRPASGAAAGGYERLVRPAEPGAGCEA